MMMRFFILLLMALCLAIQGCGGETKATFPPPAGYASWEEYNNKNPGGATTQISTQPPAESKPVVTVASTSSTPLKSKATFEPIVITGSGDKTSAPFTVTTNEWIIDWSYITSEPDYSVISFFVYPRGETVFYVESVLFPKETSGSTYSYAGPGEYYVKVSAGNIDSWTITIKPPN